MALGKFFLEGEQQIIDPALAGGQQQALLQVAGHQVRLGEEFGAHIGVVAPAAALVRIVGLVVVLEAVDDAVVVHVHAEEKVRRVHLEAQEGLGVVWLAVEIAVSAEDIAVWIGIAFFVVGLFFVVRSFYGMRIVIEGASSKIKQHPAMKKTA